LNGGDPYHLTVHQLEQQNAQRPHIGFVVVSVHVSNFGSHVVKRATNTLLLEAFKQLTGPTEVTQLDVEIVVEKKVFGFDVSVDDAEFVQMSHCANSLVKESKSKMLRESFARVNVEKQATVFGHFEKYVYALLVFKVAHHFDYEGVVQLRVDPDLFVNVEFVVTRQTALGNLFKRPLLMRRSDW
jgi:hypothetical protein